MFGIASNKSSIYDLSLGVASFKETPYSHYIGRAQQERLESLVERRYEDNRNTKGVVLTGGAIHGIDLIIRTQVKRGDSVLIPEYYFPPYVDLLKRVNANIIKYPFKIDYGKARIDLSALEELVKSDIKLVILNFPHNPTGALLRDFEAKGLSNILSMNKVKYLSDEVYEYLDYSNDNVSISRYNDNGYVVSSMSKSHAVPGIRLGWVFSNLELLDSIKSLLSNSVGGISQPSIDFAVANFDALVDKSYLQTNRDIAAHILISNHIDHLYPESGLFFLIKSRNCALVVQRLLEIGIKVINAECFGMPGYIRASFAIKHEHIKFCYSALATIVTEVENA